MSGLSPSPAFGSKLRLSAASALAGGGSRWLALALLARVLPPEEFGRLAWWLGAVELGILAATAGWMSALTRFTAAEPAGAARWQRWGRFGSLGTALVVLAAALALRPAGTPDLLVAAVAASVLLGVAGNVGAAVLSGAQGFAALARRSVAGGALALVGALAGGTWAGSAGALAGFALGSLPLALVRAPARGEAPPALPSRPEDARRFARFVALTAASRILAGLVWARADLVILGAYLSAAELAAYASALLLASLPVQVALLGRGALLPHFASLPDDAARRRAHRTATVGAALVLLPLCGWMAGVAPVAARWFEPSMRGAVSDLASALCLGAGVHAFAAGGALLAAGERNGFLLASAVAGTVVLVVVALVAIPAWGAWGAVAARTASQALMALGGAAWLVRLRLASFPVGDLAALAALAVAVAAAGRLLPESGSPIVGVALPTLAVAVLLVLVFRVRPGLAVVARELLAR